MTVPDHGWRRTILAIIGLVVTVTARAEEPIPGTGALADTIVTDLPWAFTLTREDSAVGGSGAVTFRYESVSTDMGSGGIRLRAILSARRFADPETARRTFVEIQASAHPDMGLSYAWDFVILRQPYLYRLHAGCVFSSKAFEKMAVRLKAAIGSADGAPTPVLFCRCGGGCVKSNGTQ